MNSLLPPLLSVVLSTGLSAWCCHLSGMPAHDVWIASIVAFSASMCAISTVLALVGARSRQPGAGS
jgi:hypothetical protein